MADYTPLDINTLLPGKPVTSAKALAFYENPIAIAEGATGAPKVKNKALAGLFLGSFEGENTVWTGLSDLDDIDAVFLAGATRATGTNVIGSISIRFSSDNGSSWGPTTTLFSGEDQTIRTDGFHISLADGSYALTDAQKLTTGTASIPSGVLNAFQIRASGDSQGVNGVAYIAFATKGKLT